MNDTLQLKGRFQQAKSKNGPQIRDLPAGAKVDVQKLESLKLDLLEMRKFWAKNEYIPDALVSVYYRKVAAKTNRIQGLLSKGSSKPSLSVVGARFSDDPSPKHIITHYIPLDVIDESIYFLEICIDILNRYFSGVINQVTLKNINKNNIKFDDRKIKKTKFAKIIVDSYYVEKMDVLVDQLQNEEESIITIFDTGEKTIELMNKIGLRLNHMRIIDETTLLLRPDELSLLRQKAPYLISMAVIDITQIPKDDFQFQQQNKITIPMPVNEPTIGVIDTMFDDSVYFSDWVEFENMLSEEIPLSPKDYNHGTAVSSIIVDGPTFNPNYDDGCGRFRVKHFGVAAGDKFSSFTILRSINEIITSNKNITVWNLSLGSILEINRNFISPEAAILDKIQYENDVIFIIAGTNKAKTDEEEKYIGAPADSINGLVVNSVDSNGKPASYSRNGPVLSFFTKPDVSYYGGTSGDLMRVCTPTGEAFVGGTSYAAPWISRKMSYLIDVLGFSREVAKAILIHSATGWEIQEIPSTLIGHGVVPININDIVQSPNDEIQFILSGVSEKYDTFNYDIPVPIDKNKHPYIVKATLCYFPCCSRNQGVDYTNTELDLQLGRLYSKGINPINNNFQSSDTGIYTWEEDARKLFRKWDNVKHIREIYSGQNKPRKVYENFQGIWGISLKTKERLDEKFGLGLRFGIVVTLKEINGVNRIDEFVKSCMLHRWIVNTIDIENRVEIYNIAEEEIEFDE